MAATAISAQAVAVRGFNPLDPIGSILDGALDKAKASLEEAVNHVDDAASRVIQLAANEAILVITSLKGAYEEILQKTYEAVDDLARKNIDRINELVSDITQKNTTALMKVMDRIEDIVAMSPLSNAWVPRLNSVEPKSFAVSPNLPNGDPSITSIPMIFRGNFPYADRSGYKPTFNFDGVSYDLTSNANKELSFTLNVASNHPNLNNHKIVYLSGELKLVWSSGWMPWSWWTTSTYKVLVGVLPPYVEKVSIVYTKAAVEVRKTFISPTVEVHRNKDHWTTDYVRFNAEPTFDVVRGSGSIKWFEKHGQIGADIESDDHNIVICKYTRKDGNGKFQVFFDQTKTEPALERREEIDNLRWGDSYTARPGTGEKIKAIRVQAFGNTVDFQPRTDNTSSPLITLREFEGTIQIHAKPASEIYSQRMAALQDKKVEVLS